MKSLFVTGLYRSGTTLADRWLSTHPQAAVFSQPSPFLWIEAKAKFLEEKGFSRPYPFGPQVQGDRDDPEAFIQFLAAYRWTAEELNGLFARQATYSGIGAPWVYEGVQFEGGTTYEVWQQILQAGAVWKPGTTLLGTKEIVSEDLIEHLLDQGSQVLLVVRHPADVLASTASGGQDYVGPYRPMLYTIRMWRRSVAELLRWKGHRGFRFLKYEDLMLKTSTLARYLGDWLGLDPKGFAAADGPLVDPRGVLWEGNASKEKITLTEQQLAWVEALCGPELRALGYEPRCAELTSPQWEQVPEPAPVEARHFDPGYSFAPAHMHWERERLMMLDHPSLSDAAARRWYIHPQVYAALRRS